MCPSRAASILVYTVMDIPPSLLSLLLLQVKSGTIFDHFLITDDEDFAEEVGTETWGETKDPEKKMKDAVRCVPYSGVCVCTPLLMCALLWCVCLYPFTYVCLTLVCVCVSVPLYLCVPYSGVCVCVCVCVCLYPFTYGPLVCLDEISLFISQS